MGRAPFRFFCDIGRTILVILVLSGRRITYCAIVMALAEYRHVMVMNQICKVSLSIEVWDR